MVKGIDEIQAETTRRWKFVDVELGFFDLCWMCGGPLWILGDEVMKTSLAARRPSRLCWMTTSSRPWAFAALLLSEASKLVLLALLCNVSQADHANACVSFQVEPIEKEVKDT